jgi:hypothetical protein
MKTTTDGRPRRATAGAAADADFLRPHSSPSPPGPPAPAPREAASGAPEAAESPWGKFTPAGALQALLAELRALRAALEDRAHPGHEPLAYRKRDAARMCGMSLRLWERLLAAGKAPRPDAYAGKCPLWIRSTLLRFLAEGGAR